MDANTEPTTQIIITFSKKQVRRFAAMAASNAMRTLGGGYDWVTPAVRRAVVADEVLGLCLGWDRSGEIAVSAIEPILHEAQRIMEQVPDEL